MREQKLKTKTILLYEHTDEMPIDLYNFANEYALQDAQIGSDMPSVVKHFEKFDSYIGKKDLDNLAGERRNLHRNLFNALNHNNLRALNYACHIHSVDGNVIWDRSAEGLKRLLSELSKDGLKVGEVGAFLVDVKKKSFWNYAQPFLKVFRWRTRLSPAKT